MTNLPQLTINNHPCTVTYSDDPSTAITACTITIISTGLTVTADGDSKAEAMRKCAAELTTTLE